MGKTSGSGDQCLNWEFITGQIEFPNAISEVHENYGILRAKIPGGWLVATVKGGPEEVAMPHHYLPRGICFVPDPSHAWSFEVVS
jgi:hypothetical protein